MDKLKVLQNIRHKKKLAESSFFEFVKLMWNTIDTSPLELAWYIPYICRELQIVGERVIKREPKEYDLIINIMPGTGKSSIALQLFPVWLWVRDPTLKIISAAHTMQLAIKNSSKSRDCLKSKMFSEVLWKDHIKFKRDKDQLKVYANSKGGERMSFGVGSKPTGNHAHIKLYDDLVDPIGVLSESVLNTANRWLTGAMNSRNVDDRITPFILIMQRLDEMDPTAHLLKKYKKTKHIVIPCDDRYDIKPAHLKKYYYNGLMDPVRKGKEVLDQKEDEMSGVDFDCQYGQTTSSLKGNIVKMEMIKVRSIFQIPEEVFTIENKFYTDTAYTSKEENDPSGILQVKPYGGYIYIFDFIKFREEFDFAIKATMEFMHSKDSLDAELNIENKASGMSIGQNLSNTYHLNAVDFNHMSGDKAARLRFCLKYIKSRVIFVRGSYLKDFVSMLLNFQKATKHDEEVDTLVMAITDLLIRGDSEFIRDAVLA